MLSGQASIIFSEGNEVFYNNVQEFNRDISIEFIKLFAEKRLREKEEKAIKKVSKLRSLPAPAAPPPPGVAWQVDWAARCREAAAAAAAAAGGGGGLVVLDALAATALRSCRYAKEIPGVKKIVVNDLDAAAIEAAEKNIAFNKIPEGLIETHVGDAALYMYQHQGAFDVVDIDPYGSASPLMDAAVQAVADGGLLCLTCTDLAVLSGGNPGACFAKYGSIPTKGKYLHELALRIVLNALETSASRYGRTIMPLASLAIDFYVRVFVRVHKSKQAVLESCLKRGYVYQSLGCPNFYIQPVRFKFYQNTPCALVFACAKCPDSDKEYKIGGPYWMDPIHDMKFVKEIVQRENEKGPFEPGTKTRIHGMLTAVSEELPDVPLFYRLPDLCEALHCASPRLPAVKAALINAGYRVSHFHKDPDALKTNAPPNVLWDVLRCWVKDHPVNPKRLQPGSLAHTLLSKEPELRADFSV
ncbi:unnamed protein product, partial [Heterosigma akashiwo]